MSLRRFLFAVLVPLLLAACGSAEPVWAPDDEVQRAIYHHGGPTSLTLYTVLANRDDSGAHSALMVNGSQRLIFDPAGTFRHPDMPERNDVHYGMTDSRLHSYIDYHARVTFRVVVQEILVSPEVAEHALRVVEAYGAVPKAHCTDSITTILKQLPGFEGIHRTYYPKKLMQEFAGYPLSKSEVIYDDDPDNNAPLRYVPS